MVPISVKEVGCDKERKRRRHTLFYAQLELQRVLRGACRALPKYSPYRAVKCGKTNISRYAFASVYPECSENRG